MKCIKIVATLVISVPDDEYREHLLKSYLESPEPALKALANSDMMNMVITEVNSGWCSEIHTRPSDWNPR